MKKMRKFAWIFMAAMTVAGFSACSNSEDEDLPGTGGDGGEGGNPSTPSVVVKDTIYQFNNIEAEYTPINELCPGWTHEIISPSDDDRTWQSKIFTSKTDGSVDKYIQATAHDSSDKNAGLAYDWWMISPALNVKEADKKIFSFYSQGAYWQNSTKLEVYVMNEPKSTASSKVKLEVNLVTEANANPVGSSPFGGWVASGNISLEGKGDIVYIGFHYTAEGGKGKSTTYCIDDFAFGRNQVAHFIEEGVEPEPTPEVDWTKAKTVAEALEIANGETFAVKGYVVGCIKYNPSKTSYKSFDEAKQAGDIEWAGAAEFTGYSQVFIADNAEETDGSKCLLVKLNDTDAAKSLRDAAKLEGHPERIGMTVYVNGLKKANYGLPGIREIDAFKVEE